MARFLYNGGSYWFTNNGDNAAAITAGDVVVNGNLFGVASENIPVGGLGAIQTQGVFEIAKASGAVSVGAALYWDASNSQVTTTASTNLLCGIAVSAALSGDATVKIMINHWVEKASGGGGGGT